MNLTLKSGIFWKFRITSKPFFDVISMSFSTLIFRDFYDVQRPALVVWVFWRLDFLTKVGAFAPDTTYDRRAERAPCAKTFHVPTRRVTIIQYARTAAAARGSSAFSAATNKYGIPSGLKLRNKRTTALLNSVRSKLAVARAPAELSWSPRI